MSVIATGSIEISGNPFMKPSSPDSILFMAGGDLSISATPGRSNDNFDGLIYAESQCKVSGNPTVEGQLLCKNKPNAAGTVEYASQNEISGSMSLRYSCNGKINGRRRIMEWIQRYKHRLVVVAENHSVIGGLGEAVASALLRHRVQPAGFELAGLPDAFLDAGALPTLHDRYGISREALGARIKGWLQ